MCIRRSHESNQQAGTPADEYKGPWSVNSDVPLQNPDEDGLGRARLAEQIADGIAGSDKSSSLVMGVYGRWGSGKSTMLNFIEHYIKEMPNVICLRFNPWIVGGEDELLVAFMASLAHAVKISDTSRAKKAAATAGVILDYASVFVRLGSLVPAFAAANAAADASSSLADKLKGLSQSSLEEKKNTIGHGLEESNKRIVVIMDDLDRLDKRELNAVMKLVKLVADFPSTVYVLAFDDEMVARAIGEMYTMATSPVEAEQAGRDYLEKIVQLPIRLPIATQGSLRHMTLEAIERGVIRQDIQLDQNEGELQRLLIAFDRAIAPFIRTPRTSKQIGNKVDWALSVLRGEVNNVDVILLEAMAVCQPKLHKAVLDQPSLFCDDLSSKSAGTDADLLKKDIRLALESAMAPEEGVEHRDAWFLLNELFPRTKRITSNTTYGPEWDGTWDKEQRVASKKYLLRYVHMTVPETDVSDVAVESLVKDLPGTDAQQATILLHQILTPSNSREVISKLRQRAKTMGYSGAISLAHGLACLSDDLPEMTGLYSILSAAERAPILVRDLLARIDDTSERRKVAAQVLQESASLQFAMNVHRWVRYWPAPQDSSTSLFDEDESKSLAGVVLERIRKMAAENAPLYVQRPKDAKDVLLFWDWHGPKREAKDYVTKTVQTDAPNAMALLKVFQPVSQSLENGQTFRDSLDANAFLPLSRIVDVHVMRAALEQVLGETLSTDEYVHISGDVDNKQLATQFAYFCEHPPKADGDATTQGLGKE